MPTKCDLGQVLAHDWILLGYCGDYINQQVQNTQDGSWYKVSSQTVT